MPEATTDQQTADSYEPQQALKDHRITSQLSPQAKKFEHFGLLSEGRILAADTELNRRHSYRTPGLDVNKHIPTKFYHILYG